MASFSSIAEYVIAQGGAGGWVLDLDTDYPDLTAAAPGGIQVTEPTVGVLGSASIHAGEMILVHGAIAGGLNGSGVNPYSAPRIEFVWTPADKDSTGIMQARIRMETPGSGSFPEGGVFVCVDSDTPGGDRAQGNFRTVTPPGALLLYKDLTAFVAGAAITAAQRAAGVCSCQPGTAASSSTDSGREVVPDAHGSGRDITNLPALPALWHRPERLCNQRWRHRRNLGPALVPAISDQLADRIRTHVACNTGTGTGSSRPVAYNTDNRRAYF